MFLLTSHKCRSAFLFRYGAAASHTQKTATLGQGVLFRRVTGLIAPLGAELRIVKVPVRTLLGVFGRCIGVYRHAAGYNAQCSQR